jgi:hypothetical protein
MVYETNTLLITIYLQPCMSYWITHCLNIINQDISQSNTIQCEKNVQKPYMLLIYVAISAAIFFIYTQELQLQT